MSKLHLKYAICVGIGTVVSCGVVGVTLPLCGAPTWVSLISVLIISFLGGVLQQFPPEESRA